MLQRVGHVPTGRAMGGPWSTRTTGEGWEHSTSPETQQKQLGRDTEGMDSLPRSQPVLHPLGAVGGAVLMSPGLGGRGGVWGKYLMRAQGRGDKKGSQVRESGVAGETGRYGPQCRGGELAWRPRAHVLLGAFL